MDNEILRQILEEDRKAWTEENYDLGIALGYPKCCVEEFCFCSPKTIAFLKTDSVFTKQAKLRYNSGCINGKFTGFIPCYKCALDIRKGKSVYYFIKNRNPVFGFFPKDLITEDIIKWRGQKP